VTERNLSKKKEVLYNDLGGVSTTNRQGKTVIFVGCQPKGKLLGRESGRKKLLLDCQAVRINKVLSSCRRHAAES